VRVARDTYLSRSCRLCQLQLQSLVALSLCGQQSFQVLNCLSQVRLVSCSGLHMYSISSNTVIWLAAFLTEPSQPTTHKCIHHHHHADHHHIMMQSIDLNAACQHSSKGQTSTTPEEQTGRVSDLSSSPLQRHALLTAGAQQQPCTASPVATASQLFKDLARSLFSARKACAQNFFAVIPMTWVCRAKCKQA